MPGQRGFDVDRWSHKDEVCLIRGRLCLAQDHDWWHKEDFKAIIDHQLRSGDTVEYVGMRIDARSERLGFEQAHVQWICPFMHITEEPEFTKPKYKTSADTMKYSIPPIDIYVVPLWSGKIRMSIAGAMFRTASQGQLLQFRERTASCQDGDIETLDRLSTLTS